MTDELKQPKNGKNNQRQNSPRKRQRENPQGADLQSSKQNQQPKHDPQPKSKKSRYKLPYILHTDPSQFELQFYERYDESYLFNKAVTLMYAAEQGVAFKQQIQTYMDEWQGGSLTDKYVESIRAELFFAVLHQFELFFALLIAPFKQIPTWIYLTAYTTEEIKAAIRQFLDGDLAPLTNGFCQRGEERKLLVEALYMGSKSAEPDSQARWDENLDNGVWLIRRLADKYLANLKAYNSYKHGLRTLTQSNVTFGMQLNDALGNPSGRGFARTSEDSLSFLELEETDEGTTVHEKTIFFDPGLSFFYLTKMTQLMQTFKLTRLAVLRGDKEGPSLNMLLSINKDGIVEEEAKSWFEFRWQV